LSSPRVDHALPVDQANGSDASLVGAGCQHGAVADLETLDLPRPQGVRRVLVVVSAVVLVDVCFYSAITPLLPSYVAELRLSKSQAGVLAGSYAVGTLLASLPAGWLAARRGARPSLLVGLGLLTVASVAFGVGRSFAMLTGARFVQGVGGAASWAAGLAWLVEVAPRNRRGQMIGTVLGTGIAGAIGGPVLGALAHALSPAAVFSTVGAVGLVLAGVVLLTPVGGEAPPAGSGLWSALGERLVLAGAWLTTLPTLFFGVFGVLVSLHLAVLGADATQVAAVFLCAAAAEAAASPVVGRLSDRRGRRMPVRVGLVGILIACLALPVSRRAWVLAVVVVAGAAVAGMILTPASALLADGAEAAGLAQGVVFGLFNLAWAIGQVLGSAGGARLADATSDAVPYLVVAGLCAVTLLALTFARPPPLSRHRSHPQPGSAMWRQRLGGGPEG
jgi:MFS family permease